MAKSKFDWHAAQLTDDTRVTDNYRTTQNVRRYMAKHVPNFTFSRDSMTWIRANEGITLADVAAEAKRRSAEK